MRSATIVSFSNLEGSDDKHLVNLARNGDEGAVGLIVKRHNRRLYRVAWAVLRDDAEAEDVVQETYVRAFASLGGFRDESALSTWLTRIALNEALGRVRRRRPGIDASDMEGGEGRGGARIIDFPKLQSPSNPEADMARRQVRQLLERAVVDLPEPFRLVFVLREIEEMNTDETAALLELKPETVKTRLHRARRLARKSLERELSSTFSDLFPFDGARCDRMGARVIRRLQGDGLLKPGEK